MAPEWVLDYVVAHEVSHLIEMNHSRSFWHLVNDLVGRVEEAKSWLQHSGAELHRYG
jgi:predicted metal-dependent hydrolase